MVRFMCDRSYSLRRVFDVLVDCEMQCKGNR